MRVRAAECEQWASQLAVDVCVRLSACVQRERRMARSGEPRAGPTGPLMHTWTTRISRVSMETRSATARQRARQERKGKGEDDFCLRHPPMPRRNGTFCSRRGIRTSMPYVRGVVVSSLAEMRNLRALASGGRASTPSVSVVAIAHRGSQKKRWRERTCACVYAWVVCKLAACETPRE